MKTRTEFPDGVWPVMLTPFTEDDRVDYEALGRLVDWYIAKGAAGLFADCQSSEMFFLSLEERVKIAAFVKERAAGRVPVIASGHVADSVEEQAEELRQIQAAGVDALILLTNRLAREEEDDGTWLRNMERLMDLLPPEIPLGFYECPYPYKRLLSPALLEWCLRQGRFRFIKDTSCDLGQIRAKLDVIRGTELKLYNANSATLLPSLRMGASGFSGVMANFHPELYVWLAGHPDGKDAELVADFLSLAALIERQVYPVNAKYFHMLEKNFSSCRTRSKAETLSPTAQLEVRQMAELTAYIKARLARLEPGGN